jgi:hypothetical protein
MVYSSEENGRIIVRMIQQDRQKINSMIQHKRDEFEYVIKRGIISMLNAQDERRELSEQRSQYLNFLTKRHKTTRDKITNSANAIKESVSSAPIGVGTATNLAITAASTAGTIAFDSIEDRRQEKDMVEELYSAQILHYISSKDYENIAKKVASILSYRFQFLLFRLASGENGYIKFANFLVSSMRNYVIDRLREHKGEEVKALIDAAIPPSTDLFRYRDWPRVELSNYGNKPVFGARRTLELDDEANQILLRCGPAVRSLLGGLEKTVNSNSGKLIYYREYTILGALNHASIVNWQGEVVTGLEVHHRKYEILNGSNKYPVILLGLGETTADLGVNFATKSKGQFLEDAHVEVLQRLVPDFFSHEVNYTLPTSKKAAQQLKVNYADLRYPNERYECPWTRSRENAWNMRDQEIYAAAYIAPKDDESEVVVTNNFNKLKAMQMASNAFDADEAKKNVIKVTRDVLLTQYEVREVDLKSHERALMKLNAAIAAKYAAFATIEFMKCVVNCNLLEDNYFTLAKNILIAARSAIYATRRLPIDEASVYRKSRIS